MEPPPTNQRRQEANDTVGICGALDATAEVVMAEGDPSQAAELLKDAVKLARNTKMQVDWTVGPGWLSWGGAGPWTVRQSLVELSWGGGKFL